MPRPAAAAAALVLLTPGAAAAAEAAGLDGRALSPLWAVPFAGVLLSIALMPILAERFWHRHYGKVAAFWGVLTMAALLAEAGGAGAAEILLHTVAQEYVPFVLLLTALYTVTGGMRLDGPFTGTPASNTALLAAGTALASVTGTTGAAMLLIRPVVRANAWRHRRRHTIVFFVFLVANIGGSLTPLGDPPLFLGFLKGVPFFWPTVHLLGPMLLCSAVLLAIHHLIDASLARKEGPAPPPSSRRLRLDGAAANLPLLAAILLAVLLSGVWDGGVAFEVPGATVTWQALLRDLALLAIIAASLALTPAETRRANDFAWGPMAEVAKLFAAIFVTIVPVIAMLRAGREGVFAPIVDLATGPAGEPVDVVYFWATGLLSSVLDNAPTYLVFFNLAGGDAALLTTALPATLTAISAGAVFMGANTYIGNAPNFMVRAVAEDMGVRMPSFFAYTLWSGAVLLPLFALVTVVFFL